MHGLISGFVRGFSVFLGIILVITLSQALNIQTNVTETVSYMKTMYFTKDGKIMSGDNTSVLLDGAKGTVSLSGSVDILPGKLKDNTIVGNDIGIKTIGGVDIANKSVIESKLQEEIVDSAKLKDRGVMSQDLKDVSIGASNLDQSKMYEIDGYIDNDNTTKKVVLSGTSEMNNIVGVEMNATSAMKVKTNMSVGTNPIGTKSLTVSGEINGDADICGGYDHPVYGKQSKVCLGGKPLELGALEAGKWCKVTDNKIDCIYDDIFSFDWKISNWGGCSATSSWGSWSSCTKTCGGGTQTRNCVQPNGTQTRTVVCERSDGAIVADSFCKAAKPPLTQTCNATLDGCGGLTTQSQSCNTQSCVTYSWETTGWSSCNGGTWSAWSTCSKTCGGGTQSRVCNSSSGTQTRTVVCKNNSGVTVADSNCTGSKPTTSQSCTSANCVGPTSQLCNTQACKYTVSGVLGSNGAGAQVNVCGAIVTADSSGNFVNYNVMGGTICNNISASKEGFNCTITAQGPSSVNTNFNGVLGSCVGGKVCKYAGGPKCNVWKNGVRRYECTSAWVDNYYDDYECDAGGTSGDVRFDGFWEGSREVRQRRYKGCRTSVSSVISTVTYMDWGGYRYTRGKVIDLWSGGGLYEICREPIK